MRWEGYTSDDDTWEYREDIQCDDLLKRIDADSSTPAFRTEHAVKRDALKEDAPKKDALKKEAMAESSIFADAVSESSDVASSGGGHTDAVDEAHPNQSIGEASATSNSASTVASLSNSGRGIAPSSNGASAAGSPSLGDPPLSALADSTDAGEALTAPQSASSRGDPTSACNEDAMDVEQSQPHENGFDARVRKRMRTPETSPTGRKRRRVESVIDVESLPAASSMDVVEENAAEREQRRKKAKSARKICPTCSETARFTANGENAQYLTCAACSQQYHQDCVGMLDPDKDLSQWRCPTCVRHRLKFRVAPATLLLGGRWMLLDAVGCCWILLLLGAVGLC